MSRDGPGAPNVRAATTADAARLAELSGQLGYPVTAASMADRLARVLGREDNVVLVADDPAEGPVAGWVHAAEQDLLESERRCEILGLVVDERCRGRGMGRRLVAAVRRWAADRGLERIVVRSNAVRAESHPFYEHLGFVRIKTQHVYRDSSSGVPA